MKYLSWGLIGGGEGSQIGGTHRIAAQLDGKFCLKAGALDIDRDSGKAFAQRLGIAADRAYGDWREMLEAEKNREDRLDLVTIATPNNSHYEIAKAFLQEGFDVLCEKPLTTTVEQAREIVVLAENRGRICAVNYGYSGYPMVRQCRAMVARGDLGKIRVVVAEFAHGHHADESQADNPRIKWRYDPAQAGVSSVLADAGIHALHLACFTTGQEVSSLAADFASTVEGRQLEDDALLAFRMSGGAVGRLWTSAVAVGRAHGLTIAVYGGKGGLRWQQEQPNQLLWSPVNGATVTLERAASDLEQESLSASRAPIGHPEGFFEAFGNVYVGLAEALLARQSGRKERNAVLHYPTADDGFRSVAAVHAAAQSAGLGGIWVDAVSGKALS
ncbi:MAG: Gfo/Idh/MocA family oxidoreductase [Rhodanobacter sp.]|nr:MAG: Gfo/Idh/MocA family oxidoreductase [Rhodanobacter sp.]